MVGVDITMLMDDSHDTRSGRAALSLEGLSVGDAFGERYFHDPDIAAELIRSRALPAPPWRFTDDTLMALSVAETLRRYDGIDPDFLASSLAERHDPSR